MENAKEAVEKKTEETKNQGPSGKENITEDYEKEEGIVIVDHGTIPDGAHTGKIEWSEGESIGENSDKIIEEAVVDPTIEIPEPRLEDNSINSGSVSGGDINYEIPEDMFEPVEFNNREHSIDVTQFYEALAEQMVEQMADNPMTLEEESGKQL